MYRIKKGCPGCRMCIMSCPVKAISIKDASAVIGDNCIDCGVCTYSCPVGLIEEAEQTGTAAKGENTETHGIRKDALKKTRSTSGSQGENVEQLEERKGEG